MKNAMSFHSGDTLLHRCDARVKVVAVFAYSIALLLARSWWAMGVLAGLFAIAAVAGKLPLRQAMSQLISLGVILAFTVAVPVLSGQGLLPGLYNACRIALLVAASLVITGTTSSEQLARALDRLLSPLGRIGVPTRDIATAASIGLRFIPAIIDEYHLVRLAQQSRGARFESGGPVQRIRAWRNVFIPLFVGLFRRAETLAVAMDARCYGAQAESSMRLRV